VTDAGDRHVTDADDLIKGVRLSEAHVPLCLRGDLLASQAELERKLAEAYQRDQGNSLASGGNARVVAEELEAVLAEISENTHLFRFRALPRPEFRDLQEAHPPRPDNDMDRAIGGNMETLTAPLIQACCIDPVMTLEQVQGLLEVLSDGQTMDLFGCAITLNRSRVDLPKFETASAILARLAPRSKPPDLGGSPASASLAGNPAR
jgi:hypothetical protein